MTEDFVPFEIAKKLKEKGYPQQCGDNAYILEDEYEEFEVGSLEFIPLIPEHVPTVVAPTISQALKWLREEKKIHIHSRYSFANSKWWWNISMLEKHNLEYSDAEYQSHEAAVLAGIECALGELP